MPQPLGDVLRNTGPLTITAPTQDPEPEDLP
jgi:hypothetical protein